MAIYVIRSAVVVHKTIWQNQVRLNLRSEGGEDGELIPTRRHEATAVSLKKFAVKLTPHFHTKSVEKIVENGEE